MSIINKVVILILIVYMSTFLSMAREAPSSNRVLHCSRFPRLSLADGAPLELARVALTSYENRSISSATVRNVSGKSIESILLLVEFANGDDGHLETGLYYATTHRFPDDTLSVQQGLGVQRIFSPLGPTKELNLTAVSDMVLLSCPAKAIASKAEVRFSDGSKWSYSLPGWITDPFFSEATVDIKSYPRSSPSIFWATLELNSKGHATLVRGEGGDIDVQLLGWLQEQLDTWTIVPGARGPLARDTQKFVMMIKIGAATGHSHPDLSVLKLHSGHEPLIVVDVADPISVRGSGKVAVMIGGMLASQSTTGIDPD
jgi:hypothetical protein